MRADARILGIESSCDETAAAVVDAAGTVQSSVVSSQLDVHRLYGGVVPELASREHLRNIVPVVRRALTEADAAYKDLAAVAVTAGPGLAGALLVGITYAKGVAFAAGIPLIGVNHLDGHIHAVLLDALRETSEVEFPALALIVSGGHTHLYLAEQTDTEPGTLASSLRYRLLGRTRDDAIGEAYDKVAVTLGFGYPGGPLIDKLAAYGMPGDKPFTVPYMKGNPLDFSFSGYKTAAIRWRDAQAIKGEVEARQRLREAVPAPALSQWLEVTPQATLDVLASFQKTAVDNIEANCLAALAQTGARSLIVSGGVASNSALRARLLDSGFPVPAWFPRPQLSTDNAVMIAAAAFARLARGEFSDMSLNPQPAMRLDTI
ncbi:MAG: tRNA (adenosine(37)-N6)-threonylcarbamoyltransferase complex transferase subunit TsaD [Bryobacterales bacterium]|nr:tRNA (adenosine(37)-N6)-threonylcarbamoyltransferase complex transferase subunit TsaD [Bryobacterales bacterium]